VFPALPSVVELPTDFPRGSIRSLAGATAEFTFDRRRTAGLRALALREGVTLFHALFAAYSVFLARITGADDATVGTPVAGRTSPGLDRVVGMFVNTVCLRTRPRPQLRFTEFLRQLSADTLAAMEHHDYPFDDLVARVSGVRDYARNPLFDTMFALQPEQVHDLRLLGAPVRLVDEGLGQSMFDLNLHVFEHPEELTAVWGYSTALFVADSVRAFADVLVATVDAVLADPDTRIGDLLGRPAPQQAPAEIEFAF